MDLWSFIPYYIARLCTSLREQGIEVDLGSVRYHLQRKYFRDVGLRPDPWLIDIGGRLPNSFARRVAKCLEYAVNLCILGLRLPRSIPTILHVQYLPFLERGFQFEICFLRWMKRLGIRLVYTVHNVTPQDAHDKHKPLYAQVYRMSDALICHGEEAREQLTREFGVPTERIRVIPHGPLFDENPRMSPQEARAQLGLPSEEILVLCFGVISEYKGIPFLLDAWKRLIESGVKGQLIIAGTGDPRLLSQIREKVSSDNVQTSVHLWLRFVTEDKLRLIHQAVDILVYPYRTGTTSGALLTGMNYGKAIIATTLPFFREHLTHQENALLLAYGDTDAWAKGLTALICNSQQRDRLARNVETRRSSQWAWTSIARATTECYRAVVRSSSTDGY